MPERQDIPAAGVSGSPARGGGWMAAVPAGVTLALGGAALAAGGLRIEIHEGDALHLLEILLRMLNGETPHLDFQTPLGVLGLAPVAMLMRAGWAAGPALILAQVFLALLLLPVLWWIGRSRLPGAAGALFGAAVLVQILALVYGGLDAVTSVSMHYNRWSWGIAFAIIALAVLPPRLAGTDRIDGIVIGLGLAALLLIKITYFVAFAPPVALILLIRGAPAALAAAALAGLAVLAGFTLWSGPDYWLAYAADVAAAAGSDLRAPMRQRLVEAVFAPVFLCASLALIAAIRVLNRTGATRRALALLLLAPGFLFVSSQNFGNDPIWLILVALLLYPGAVADRPAQPCLLLATVSLALVAPYLVNLAASPIRHLTLGAEAFEELVPGIAAADGLSALRARIDERSLRWPPEAGGAEALSGPLAEFAGPACEEGQLVRVFRRIGDGLARQTALSDATIFVADRFSAHLIYAGLAPLPGGTPWYYSGLPGWDNASHLLVPVCPTSAAAREVILREIDAIGPTLRRMLRTPDYVVFEIARQD